MLPPVGYDRDEGRRWPMILAIHGGPHGCVRRRVLLRAPAPGRRKGYFVLTTNPRASTGYGEDVPVGHVGELGRRGLRRRHGGRRPRRSRDYPVDPERMGVTGYSYGGYLTNWIITRTRSLRRRRHRRRYLELGERLRNGGYTAHQGERVLRPAVGGGGAEEPPRLVAHRATRRACAHPPFSCTGSTITACRSRKPSRCTPRCRSRACPHG